MRRVGVAVLAAIFAMSSLMAAASAQSAGGQDTPLLVTARKKEEPLLTAPVAVSVYSQATLHAAGASNTLEVLPLAPNVSVAGGVGGELQGLASIRGIASLVRVVGVESGMSIYVDEVYIGRPDAFQQLLIDVDRVELVRGPQGALYGRSAIAGVLNVKTIEPSEGFSAAGEATLGDYGLRRVAGYVAGALAPGLNGAFALGREYRDGFVRHVQGGQNLDTLDGSAARAKLRVSPTPALTATLSVDVGVDRGRPVFVEASDVDFIDDPTERTPFTTNQNQPNYLHRIIYGGSIHATADLPIGHLTSITATRRIAYDAALDDDKLPVRYTEDTFGDRTRLWSQEVRLSRMLGDHADLLVGAYYFRQRAWSFRPYAIGESLTGVPGLTFPILMTSATSTETVEAFVNTDVRVTDRWTAGIGARFTRERRTARYLQIDAIAHLLPDIDFRGAHAESDVSPVLSLTYTATDYAMLYGRIARGYKSAGFNTEFATSAADLMVNPETAISYEIGGKFSTPDRGRLAVALYATDYANLQVSQIVAGGVALRNATSARIHGAEIEGVVDLTPDLQLQAGAGYTHARYGDFPGCPAPGRASPSEIRSNCRGNTLVLAPAWTAQLAIEKTIRARDAEWYIRVSNNYRSRVYFEPQNTERLSGRARALVDAALGYRTATWDASIWSRNILDQTYVDYADDRSPVAIPLTQAFGAPRTFGVTLRARY